MISLGGIEVRLETGAVPIGISAISIEPAGTQPLFF